MDENKTVLVEKKGFIGYIILNRPEKLNALTDPMYMELLHAVDYMEEQDDVRVVVVKGAGKCFSAGFDVASSDTSDHMAERRNYDRGCHLARKKLWSIPKPTIAQVHSHCLGGAHDIALACDLCVVAENANMGVPEIQFGLGATFLAMPYMIHLRKCKEYLLTGKSYDGKTAVEIGIANYCVPLEELDSTVVSLAKELASVPVPSMVMQKRAINHAIENMGFAVMAEQWLDTLCMGVLWESEDIALFNKKVEELGTKGAIKWRNAYYEQLMQQNTERE